MLSNLEKMDDQYLKCIINIPKEQFNKAELDTFLKTKEKYKIPGMETGKIPRPIIKKYYGEAVFYEDTINSLIKDELKEINNKYKITEDKVQEVNILQLEKNKDVVFELIIQYKGENI